MEKYQHRRHNKNLLMVHLIFVTKYRKKILLGNFNNDIKQYIFDICQERHSISGEMNSPFAFQIHKKIALRLFKFTPIGVIFFVKNLHKITLFRKNSAY